MDQIASQIRAQKSPRSQSQHHIPPTTHLLRNNQFLAKKNSSMMSKIAKLDQKILKLQQENFNLRAKCIAEARDRKNWFEDKLMSIENCVNRKFDEINEMFKEIREVEGITSGLSLNSKLVAFDHETSGREGKRKSGRRQSIYLRDDAEKESASPEIDLADSFDVDCFERGNKEVVEDENKEDGGNKNKVEDENQEDDGNKNKEDDGIKEDGKKVENNIEEVNESNEDDIEQDMSIIDIVSSVSSSSIIKPSSKSTPPVAENTLTITDSDDSSSDIEVVSSFDNLLTSKSRSSSRRSSRGSVIGSVLKESVVPKDVFNAVDGGFKDASKITSKNISKTNPKDTISQNSSSHPSRLVSISSASTDSPINRLKEDTNSRTNNKSKKEANKVSPPSSPSGDLIPTTNRRTRRKSVNYALPSLKAKMRRPISENNKVSKKKSSTKRKSHRQPLETLSTNENIPKNFAKNISKSFA